MLLKTSLAKKNFPSDGTITTWILSESRSAMILLISSGDLFSSAASLVMRSALAAAIKLDAARFGVGQQVAPLQFGLAVDHLGLRVGIGILNGRFLARFGFQLALLNLLLLQRQRVLHGIGLALGLHHLGLRVAFSLLHLLHGLGFGLQLGNLHLLLLDVGVDAHLVVLLLLQQQSFQALGVLVGQLNVREHHLFDDDAVGRQLARDDCRSLGAHFFAL